MPAVRRIATVFVRPLVLFHVILPGEGLAARRADHALLARMLFPMTRRVTGCGEGIGTIKPNCVRARELFLCWRSSASRG